MLASSKRNFTFLIAEIMERGAFSLLGVGNQQSAITYVHHIMDLPVRPTENPA